MQTRRACIQKPAKKLPTHAASSAKYNNKTAGGMKYAVCTSCRQLSLGIPTKKFMRYQMHQQAHCRFFKRF